MKKKKVAIVFGITDSYVNMLANVLIGLKKHSKKFWDDIIIYHEDVSKRHQTQINLIMPCSFVKLSSDDFSKFVSKEQLELYSAAAFFRFECFKLLNDYEKVIWQDVDILMQKDQEEILEYADKTGIALVQSDGFRVEHNFFKLIPEYNMFAPLYNSGLMVISDKMKNYNEIYKWCYSSIKKYGESLRWIDQGIINLMIQEFSLDVEKIDRNKWQCFPLDYKYINDASIIHAYGIRKFWNDDEYKKMFPEWVDNYNEWKSIQFSDVNSNPLVSVLMSTYNRYDFLKESIDSILNQTYQNFELIVVLEYCDNQDIIEKILKEYNDARIKIIKNTSKLGFSKSLNIGFDAANGKYVARMDDDDISLPERFERQVDFLENNPDIGACGTRAEFFMYASGVFNYIPTDPEEVKVKMLSFSPICHPSIMMRKEAFDRYKLRYDPNYFTEDYELWSRAIEYIKIANLDDVLLRYRASNQNATAGSNEQKIHSSHKAIIQNQCKKYLNIELTDNELELLQGRKEIIESSIDQKHALEMRNRLYKKIIIANQKTHFYDEKVLKSFLSIDYDFSIHTKQYNTIGHSIKKGIKKIIKPIYRPIYNSFERRIFGIVDNQKNIINNYSKYCTDRIINQINNRFSSLSIDNLLNKRLLIIDAISNDIYLSSLKIKEKASSFFANTTYISIEELKKINSSIKDINQFTSNDEMNNFIYNNHFF